jgi:hypothetical protein
MNPTTGSSLLRGSLYCNCFFNTPNRFKSRSSHIWVVFSENLKNLWSRLDRTVVHQQNRWFSCELIICPYPINEWDQYSCYALLEPCRTHIQLGI